MDSFGVNVNEFSPFQVLLASKTVKAIAAFMWRQGMIAVGGGNAEVY